MPQAARSGPDALLLFRFNGLICVVELLRNFPLLAVRADEYRHHPKAGIEIGLYGKIAE